MLVKMTVEIEYQQFEAGQKVIWIDDPLTLRYGSRNRVFTVACFRKPTAPNWKATVALVEWPSQEFHASEFADLEGWIHYESK